MAYSKQNFQDGQILNAANLEAMENGIIAGQGARNLLVNSNFRIAHAGRNSTYDSLKYVCDKWISWDADATFGDGYITPGSPIDQRVSKTIIDINKTYTAAICFSDGTIRADSGTFANGFGSYPLGIYCMKQGDSYEHVTVRLNSGNNIRWVALYEGSYPASPLPDYIPKPIQQEMLDCGIPLYPKNLLDNSNFADLVAHDGLNKVYGDTTYLADRWIGHYHITPTANTDGILLTTTDQYAYIQQHVKVKQGKTYTLALSTTGGTTMQRIAVFNIGLTEIFAAVEGSNSVIITTFNAAYEDMAMLFYPGYADDGGSAVFKWAALYEGAYTADTLPPYVPKGKHVEMLNCNVPLTPYNLLDNSDFTNPVNQRGATTATLGKYFIDRWSTEPFPSGPSITIDSNGLTLLPTTSSTAGIYQMLPDYEKRKGKVHTFAICVDNVWKCVSFTMGNFGVGYFIHGLAFFSVDNRNILIRNNASDTPVPITIQRVALYEGSYTAETLPPYIPKGKHVEMLNCNIPLAPHNLLDNSDFTNPVNQRGKTSYGSGEYAIDRWKNQSDTNMALMDGFIRITGSWDAQQILGNKLIGTYTYAIYAKINVAGEYTQTIEIYENGSSIATTFCTAVGEWKIYTCTATFTGGTNPVVTINNRAGSVSDASIDVKWAALYEGAYDASTLPAYQPKGYAAELAECQRYYVHCGEGSWMTGFFKVGEGLVVEIPVANNIRTPYPTIIVNSPKIFTTNGWYDITYSSCAVTKCWTKLLFNIPEAANPYITNGDVYIITGIVGVSADL